MGGWAGKRNSTAEARSVAERGRICLEESGSAWFESTEEDREIRKKDQKEKSKTKIKNRTIARASESGCYNTEYQENCMLDRTFPIWGCRALLEAGKK